MSTKKRKSIGWTLREFMMKIAVLVCTICIGLWCGWNDSYNGFYIAVLIQSVNNIYDSSAFLGGYTKFITVFQILAFWGALISAVLAVIHFTNGGNIVDSLVFVIGITIALSIPILHFGLEVYSMLRHNRY